MSIFLSAPLRVILFVCGLAAALLPRPAELWLGKRLGRLALACGGFKRRIAAENIRHCFPELGPARRESLLRRNQEHYGMLFFEFLHFFCPLPGHYRSYARSICRLEGKENWERARAKGRGVLFVSCHVGFWEMLAAAGGLEGFSPLVVTTVLKPVWLDRQITACRLSTGVRAAYHPGSVPQVLRELRRGGSVAFMNDQYAGPPMGIPVPFFGVKPNTLAAVAPIAQRTGAAIVPVSCYRDEDGTAVVVVEPELDLGPALSDTEQATAILAAKVETWVRRHPEQWLWIHRRFKNVVWPEG
ncbi:MAG: lysophospholipid acyltransferase family protein [Elusimicrobia bacterium]|nr:lysophospholipid acyltransferase family protein [Elusimicrobiota bacterium]